MGLAGSGWSLDIGERIEVASVWEEGLERIHWEVGNGGTGKVTVKK